MFKFKSNALKILYKFSFFIVVICLAIMVLFFVKDCFQKAFIYPIKYRDEVIIASDKYGLESAFVFAVINVESSFDAKATSPAGAKGLMQITTKTGEFIARRLNIPCDLYDAKTNIELGCYYFRYLFDRFSCFETAIVAYNAGEGTVSGWLKDNRLSDDGESLNEIPYSESKEYLEKIKKTFKKYKELYGKFLDKRKNIE
jgi:soluble lytic murein transglycosylase